MPPKAKQQGWQPLFTTEKNAPILFWIPPHKKEHEQRRAELRDLIELGIKGDYDRKFVSECIEQKKLLDISNFRMDEHNAERATPSRKNYTDDEDMAICCYVYERHPSFKIPNLNKFFQAMADAKIVPHSYESVRNRWRKTLAFSVEKREITPAKLQAWRKKHPEAGAAKASDKAAGAGRRKKNEDDEAKDDAQEAEQDSQEGGRATRSKRKAGEQATQDTNDYAAAAPQKRTRPTRAAASPAKKAGKDGKGARKASVEDDDDNADDDDYEDTKDAEEEQEEDEEETETAARPTRNSRADTGRVVKEEKEETRARPAKALKRKVVDEESEAEEVPPSVASNDDDDDDDELDQKLEQVAEKAAKSQASKGKGAAAAKSVKSAPAAAAAPAEAKEPADLRSVIDTICKTAGCSVEEAFRALHVMSGFPADALSYILTGEGCDGAKPWNSSDSELCRSGDPKSVRDIKEKYGQQAVLRRCKYLA